MSDDDIANVQYQRDQFLKAAYQVSRQSSSQSGEAYISDICSRIGLDPDKDADKYRSLAQDLIDDGYLSSMSDGHGIVQITAAGRQRAESGNI